MKHKEFDGFSVNMFLDGPCSEMLRLQRIIMVYQEWQESLKEALKLLQGQTNFSSSYQDFLQALQLLHYLTYFKKNFFEQNFSEQKVQAIIENLHQQLTQNCQSNVSLTLPRRVIRNTRIVQLLYDLQQRKEDLKEKIDAQETRLTNLLKRRSGAYYLLYTIGANMILGLSEQPSYQLGKTTIATAISALAQLPEPPILIARLNPTRQSILEHANGLSFLSISLCASNWWGYSYYFITSVNHFLLSKIHLLIRGGSFFESILGLTNNFGIGYLRNHLIMRPTVTNRATISSILGRLLSQIENALRFDELGIIEKQHAIQWTTGLLIQLLLSCLWNYDAESYELIPLSSAYIGATAFSAAISWLLGKLAERITDNQAIQASVKILSHFLSYPFGHYLGYLGGRYLEDALTEHNRYAAALALFGLYGSETRDTINEKYRMFAKEFHPDTSNCWKTPEACSAKMQAINEAREFLIARV